MTLGWNWPECSSSKANLPAAEELLAHAMEVAPRSAAALALGGEISLLMQRQAEGISRIGRALAIDPNETLDALGLPQKNAILHEHADTAIMPLSREAVQKLEMDFVLSQAGETALAALLALAGDEDAALQAYKRIGTTRESAGSAANLFVQGKNALHQHRYDDAEQLILRWLATHRDDRVARYNLVLARREISMAQVTPVNRCSARILSSCTSYSARFMRAAKRMTKRLPSILP